MKFSKLVGDFKMFFLDDLRGFDLSLIQHAIPIKECIKLVRQKQRPINPALEETI
jgi:hypothetical protein